MLLPELSSSESESDENLLLLPLLGQQVKHSGLSGDRSAVIGLGAIGAAPKVEAVGGCTGPIGGVVGIIAGCCGMVGGIPIGCG